jgi:hypothetical protein
MEIITRQAAKAAGLSFYYTGKPCVHGHIAKRYSSTKICAECSAHYSRVGRAKQPLYNTWHGALRRCYNEECKSYPEYGGRGITVCDRWLDTENGYANFLADMGPRPAGFSLDRIDNDEGYSPENCRWADPATQARNRRNSWIKLSGEDVLEVFRLRDEGMTLKAIGDLYGASESCIWLTLKKREHYIEQGLGRSTKAAPGRISVLRQACPED